MIAFALGAVTGGAFVIVWLAILGRADARRVARERDDASTNTMPDTAVVPSYILTSEQKARAVVVGRDTARVFVKDLTENQVAKLQLWGRLPMVQPHWALPKNNV